MLGDAIRKIKINTGKKSEKMKKKMISLKKSNEKKSVTQVNLII